MTVWTDPEFDAENTASGRNNRLVELLSNPMKWRNLRITRIERVPAGTSEEANDVTGAWRALYQQ